ncbi:hypothetical protein H6F89_14340 [Cyanobacteria bacterium FACHB-63]|nr:hypothetical protein [Cyanobacteria bacterium FACHB-63]
MDAEFRELLDQHIDLQIQADAALRYYETLRDSLLGVENRISTRFEPQERVEGTDQGYSIYNLETETKRISYSVAKRGSPNRHGGMWMIRRDANPINKNKTLSQHLDEAIERWEAEHGIESSPSTETESES